MFHKDLLVIQSELKMPLMVLPVKMTLVRLESGVVLISPLPDIELFKKEVEVFGEITDIVAPSLFHNLGVTAAVKMYPKARVWGPEGIGGKVPNLKWNRFFSKEAWPYYEELPFFKIEGMPKVNEINFFHIKSKTLIVADLCFNHIHTKGLGEWFIFNLFGTYKKFAVSKFFIKMIKNKRKFTDSVQSVLNTKFENIVIPHGENISGNGSEVLAKAMNIRGIKVSCCKEF